MSNEFSSIKLPHRDSGEVPNHPVRSTLVIACGALARELLAVVQANGLTHVGVTCLPATWHMSPHLIPEGIRREIRANRSKYEEILCLYGDCGTGGQLDKILEEEGVDRIEGDHCYAFFAGLDDFKAMHEQEGATFYLTDFLVRHFEQFVIHNLGLDQYPDLLPDYFGNFKRVVYLAQVADHNLEAKAYLAAQRLGLPLEIRATGLSGLTRFLDRGRTIPLMVAP
jgi:hypothetical protein